MPELPEVETLRRQLDARIKDKKVESSTVFSAGSVKPDKPRGFSLKIKHKKIKSVGRSAKILFFEFADADFLLIHLKMTGQLIYRPRESDKELVLGGHPQQGGADDLPNKFTRVRLEFFDGSALFFNDMRKFGWMKLKSKKEAEEIFTKNGLEPLEREFNYKKFQDILDKYSGRRIKQLLMDQTLIAGIGNIYADESCFCAGIMPTRRAGDITAKEAEKLTQCIKKVLRSSIKQKGTSFRNYLDSDGSSGGFSLHLNVYGREGERCRRHGCRGKVKKIKMGGRGTHFCDDCQK